MAHPIVYSEIAERRLGFWWLFAGLALVVLLGLAGAYMMESAGHVVTGMNNRIVWGTPHVFAVFLIVAASGALNVASVASVFGCTPYKPLARLSALLAVALLAGGLAVLVLDLGRPDRLIVAMTTYNFRSIFAWNIFLYVGFSAVVLVYLWIMMERRMNRFVGPVGMMAFLWRLVLTTGTGSIFGFLVARPAYDAAVMAPLFIAMSFAFGLAVFTLVLVAACHGTGCELGPILARRLNRLLGIFAAAVLYFVAVQHLTNLYAPERQAVERFILLEGGIHTALFWIGQVIVGGIMPMALAFHPAIQGTRRVLVTAALCVVFGGLAQVYVVIIGGQAYPLVFFPGLEVSGGFQDSGVAAYVPSAPEIALGLGGVAMALILVAVVIKILPILPTSLADAAVDSHHRPSTIKGKA